MTHVLLSIGSNIDKEHNVRAVLKALQSNACLDLLCYSRVYETIAIGSDGSQTKQPSFYNLAAKIETVLDVPALVTLLRKIEADQKRVRTSDKFAPRTIDIDIVFYGPERYTCDGYSLPDPDICKFPHLACPLADIAPDWTMPAIKTGKGELPAQTLQMISERLLNDSETARQIVQIVDFTDST